MHFTTSVASFIVLALASATALSQKQSTLSGQATYYGGNVAGGTCSFSTYTLPASIYGTALSDSNWDDAENCGACVSVTGPDGNSITAMVSPLTCAHDSYLTVRLGRRYVSWLWYQSPRPLPHCILSPRQSNSWRNRCNLEIRRLPNHFSIVIGQ